MVMHVQSGSRILRVVSVRSDEFVVVLEACKHVLPVEYVGLKFVWVKNKWGLEDMSRSKQEALLLEERIEKIRKKNEEIKKRHLEVEADKQNAAKLNALVQINSPSEDWPIGGRPSPSQPPQQHRGGAGDSEPVHPEYEAWRAERNRIDNDRINRQKTAEGHWRREWDNEKITQEEEVRPANRSMRGMGPYRGSNRNSTHEFNQDYNIAKETSGFVSSHERGRGPGPRGRGILRGRRHAQAPSSELPNKGEEAAAATASPNPHSTANVRESIKICIPNDTSTPSIRRVKVSPPIVGGSGRVGPRQKIFVNYSSQSEDEAPYQRHVEIQANRVVTLSSDSTSPNLTASSSISKPPLPPSTGQKADTPKPRRQRVRRLEQDPRTRKRVEKQDDGSDTTEGKSLERETESGGDDSWEDVTTTSGTESACEEMSPHDDVAKLNEINLNMNESESILISESAVSDETAEEQYEEYELSAENVVADANSDVNKSQNLITDTGIELTTMIATAAESVSEFEDQESMMNVDNSRNEFESMTAENVSDLNKTENVVADNDFESNNSNSVVIDSCPEACMSDYFEDEVNKATATETNSDLKELEETTIGKDSELELENPTEKLDDMAAVVKFEDNTSTSAEPVAESSLKQNESDCTADSGVLPDDGSKTKELENVLITSKLDSDSGSETKKSEDVLDDRCE
ncbi:hypothetical protein C0J52_15539 [Blattella germanica]|nr:hypothetical protein C0J52_15539 [Blattella germanica]